MEISDIKNRLTIKQTLQHYNLIPDRNHLLKCPFHEDHSPSLKIYDNTNTFHCFGCGATGDVIQFIELYEKVSKSQAINKAKSLCNGYAPKGGLRTIINQNNISMTNNKESEDLTRTAVLTKAFKYFCNGMNFGKRAQEYLIKRGLDQNRLEVGFNNGAFYRTQNKHYIKSALQYGLLLPDKANEYKIFARHCIAFALRNKQSQVSGLYFRSILDRRSLGEGGTNNKDQAHYYLKDRQGLYPKYPDKETQTLILTEAVIDAATLLQIPQIKEKYEILSCYGTNGLTTEHKQAICQWADTVKEWSDNLSPHGGNAEGKGGEVIFFFDGDDAGRTAVEKYSKELHELLPGITISQVNTPDNEDVNSLSVSHEQEIFTYLISERTFLFLIERKQGNSTQAPHDPEPEQKNNTLRIMHHASLNTTNPEYIIYTNEFLQLVLLGGINMNHLDRLRVTLKTSYEGQNIRHTIDLYNDDQVERYVKKASEKLEVSSSILYQNLNTLTDQLEQYRLHHIEKQKKQQVRKRTLTEERIKQAVEYLESPNLLERTNRDIGRTGVVGEETNRLLMYLVFTGRLREKPLHIVTLGSSAAGKTHLQESIAELIPDHEKIEITDLSDNAFYYFDRKELKHKLVILEDLKGAENVMYAIRELQTKKRINKTVVMKDSKGNLRTVSLQVEGPICLSATTTMEQLYEDNASRSILIYRDESRSHQNEVMNNQRMQSAGRINTKDQEQLKEFFKDIQSVLKPIRVRNPYAEYLQIPDEVFKPLRTNEHYLLFIETVTFYHQYQREIKTDPETGEAYIETTIEDIEAANLLIKDVLLAKSDELTKACRGFFERLKYWLKQNERVSFYAKEVRYEFRMSSSRLNRYMLQLLRNSYIKITGGDKYKKGYEYEVTSHEEYKKLQDNIDNVLDNCLKNIKHNSPTIPQYPKSKNGTLNNKKVSKLEPVSH